MPINFQVELPIANVFKFTLEGEDTSERASFDQRRYYDSKHAGMDQRGYFELWEKAKAFKLQAWTNFSAVWMDLINCDGNVFQTINGTRIKEYRNQHYYSSAEFATVGGKIFIFFRNEAQYSDSDWTDDIAVTNFGGKLPPIEAAVGNQIRYVVAGNEYTSEILEITWSPEWMAEGYLMDHDLTLSTAEQGTIDVTYDEKPVDLWEINGDMSLVTSGLAYCRMFFGLENGGLSYGTYLSEPIDVQVKHADAKLLMFRQDGDYQDEDQWNFIYPPAYYSTLFVPAQMYQLITAGELETDVNDSGDQRKTRAMPYRQLQLNILDIPAYILDKLMVIFSHDHLVIDEYRWEIDNYGQFEGIQQVDLGTLQINLRQKDDRTLFKRTFIGDFAASFTPDMETVPFEENNKTYDFSSTLPGAFHFINLPAWITVVSGNSFIDGDTVELQFAENPDAIERGVILIAQSIEFGNIVQATIDIDQEFDDTAPEFISVLPTEHTFPSAGGVYPFGVSASSAWSVVSVTGFAFTTTEVDVDQLDVSTPSPNTGTGVRDAVIRIALDSNPTVFVEIEIHQETNDDLYAVSPGTVLAPASQPPGGGTYNFGVTARNTGQWQASSPASGPPATGFNSWLHFDKTIQTGGKVVGVNPFVVIIDAKPPYVPNRVGVITLTNINNPSDYLQISITQNT